MAVVLEALILYKKYGKAAALVDFNLELEPGSIHGLLGPNGSGKTTALHILTGLLTPDAGSVRLNNLSIESKRSRGLLGFAPDDLPLPGSLTGREYLQFHDAMRCRNDQKKAEQLAEALGIEKSLNKQIAQYSHGMKRKIQVIAALAHQPQLLILDEPFRGLDPDAASVLRSLITAFAATGRAVLIATHDMLRAERDCDEVTILHEGRTVAAGMPHELIGSRVGVATLEDYFLSVTGSASDSEARQMRILTLFDREEAK